jgi:hypothetical protein
MRPSAEQMDRIYQAWRDGLPPITTAQELRLVPLTVIREFVRLDDESNPQLRSDIGTASQSDE